MSSDLQEKYDILLEDYKKLKHEYSENVIIQSMNDMKSMYNVQKSKIEKLNNVVTNISSINKSVKVMLSVLCKNINNYNFSSRYQLKHKLEFIEEMIEESLKLRNEIYYIEYEN